ncbi:MAG: hypothetical protein E6J09_08295 [Chloroflexi bacterium]|nr:MAG: hypothetical protein E6J09_08295 [Chloroflexota bacterium]
MRIALAALLVASACGGQQGTRPVGIEPPSSTPTPPASAAPSPTPPRGAPPVSTGVAPEAGVLFVTGADDWIYRYDGATGDLRRVTRHARLGLVTRDGAYAEGLEGGLVLLRWDGTVETVDCGPGRFQTMTVSGACLSFVAQDSRPVWVRLPNETTARLLLPGDWGAGQIALSPEGRRVAVLRSKPGTSFDARAHNALWIIDADGTPRRLYEPKEPNAFLFSFAWSDDGRWLTVWEQPIISNSAMADGDRLLLVDTTDGKVIDLGKTLVARGWLRWSPDGRLAFVRGGDRQTWLGKQLVIRSPDGTVRVITDGDHVGLAPAWVPGPGGTLGLTWVEAPVGDGNGGAYVAGTGAGARYGVLSNDLRGPGRQLPFAGIVEGLRPSGDAALTLVLVRRPSPPGRDEYGALELWLTKPPAGGTSTQVRLIAGLGDLAFGYYGFQPSLFALVAWSLDPR